jgi:carbonic anhydrase
MDPRLHPEDFLGIELGGAHVIRNAGGRVSDDAIRSLVISQRLLGTDEVIVIHHTGCGMMTFENEDLAAKIKEDLGADASGHDFLTFSDLEQSVREDLDILKGSDLIPGDITLVGAVYEVETGSVREIVRF